MLCVSFPPRPPYVHRLEYFFVTVSHTEGGSDEDFGGHDGHPGAESNPGLDLLNLSLAMLDRDFTDEDYEMLSVLDGNDLGADSHLSSICLPMWFVQALVQRHFHCPVHTLHPSSWTNSIIGHFSVRPSVCLAGWLVGCPSVCMAVCLAVCVRSPSLLKYSLASDRAHSCVRTWTC